MPCLNSQSPYFGPLHLKRQAQGIHGDLDSCAWANRTPEQLNKFRIWVMWALSVEKFDLANLCASPHYMSNFYYS
jgi:hypothetical protein